MVTVECHTCGEETEKKPAKVRRNDRQFCSKECYHEAGRPDMQGENSPRYKGGKVEIECEYCGDAFRVWPYRKDDAKFCSNDCQNESIRGVTGPDASSWRGDQEEYECQNCGDAFHEYPYRNSQKYCSESCYREASKEIFAGESNPAWRGGRPDNYGPNWEEQRQQALERDGYECQRCGKPESESTQSLDVHHIKRLGWFKEEYDAPDWWEKANRLSNLVALCRPCHQKIEWSDETIPRQPE